MKKLLALMLAAMLVLSLCTACGNDAVGNDGDITLTWYIPGDKQADTALVLDEFNKICMEEIGCKLDIQFIDAGSFQERMNMNMASGSDYDLAFVGYINTFEAAASKGGLMEMDELLKLTPDLVESIPEYIMRWGLYKGKMYAIPNTQITAGSVAASFPKEYADKYGLDITKVTSSTCPEVEKYLDAIKANEPNVFPFSPNWGLGSLRSIDEGPQCSDPLYGGVTQAVGAVGVSVIDRENKTFKAVNGYDPELSPGLEKARKLHEYYEKGYIRADIDSVLDETSEIKQKRFGVWFGTYKPGLDGESTQNLGYETVSTRISSISLGSALSTMIGIGKNCKHPEEAIKLIELMNTNVEAYNLICFGIEGKHYNVISENPKRIELIPDSGYMPNASWKFGNQFNAYLLPGQSDTVWEETEELNYGAYEANLKNPDLSTFGFSFDKENIKSLVTKITEVENKYSAMKTGSKDPDTYWDKMIEELYAAGLQAVMDELQLQIDTFLEENPNIIEEIKW